MKLAKLLLGVAGLLFAASVILFVLPPSDEQIVRDFHRLYYQRRSWDHMNWLGVKTLQNPPDTWVLQELITEIRPDFIIDAGTYTGGSALYMATVLEALDLPGKVLSIDVSPHVEEASKHRLFRERVEVFTGSSTDPKLIDGLRERLAGKKVLVLLDSLHTRDHVFDELNAWAPFVPVGSYLVVQDTNINGHPVQGDPGPGPWEAVHEWLPSHPEFEIDRGREKFLLTFTPDGYLKRVRPGPAP